MLFCSLKKVDCPENSPVFFLLVIINSILFNRLYVWTCFAFWPILTEQDNEAWSARSCAHWQCVPLWDWWSLGKKKKKSERRMTASVLNKMQAHKRFKGTLIYYTVSLLFKCRFVLFLTLSLLFKCHFVAWRRGFPWKFASCCLCHNK